MPSTWPTHLVFLAWISIILYKQYKLCSFSLCNFLQPPTICSVLGSNILLCPLFSHSPSLRTLVSQCFWYPQSMPFHWCHKIRQQVKRKYFIFSSLCSWTGDKNDNRLWNNWQEESCDQTEIQIWFYSLGESNCNITNRYNTAGK
jgi:hypothetical protein